MVKNRVYDINEVAPEHTKGYISARIIRCYGQMIISDDFKNICKEHFTDFDPSKTGPQITKDKQYISKQQFFDDIFERLIKGTSNISIKNPKTGNNIFDEYPLAKFKTSHPKEFKEALSECLECFGSKNKHFSR